MYCDKVTRKGNIVIKLAKLAPAPTKTNNEGKAQQINVDEEANKEMMFADLSFMSVNRPSNLQNLYVSCILTIN